MKRIIFFILIAVNLVLFFSLSKNAFNKGEIENLEVLLDQYFSVYYTYPASKESFLSFCEKDVCSKEQLVENYELIHEQFWNKEEIVWVLDDSRFPDQEFTILYDKDTIIHRHNNWSFPCIGLYNDAYVEGYLSEPPSLQDFLLFCYYCDSLNDTKDWPYYQCDSVTVMNLRRCLDVNGLKWVQDKESLIIVIDEDTVWRHNTLSPCMRNEKALVFEPRFYNNKGYYLKTSDSINRNFKNNIRNLAIRMSNQPNAELTQFHILEYSANKGLSSYCEDDDICFDSIWFRELEHFLVTFVAENDINRVIFSAPTISP